MEEPPVSILVEIPCSIKKKDLKAVVLKQAQTIAAQARVAIHKPIGWVPASKEGVRFAAITVSGMAPDEVYSVHQAIQILFSSHASVLDEDYDNSLLADWEDDDDEDQQWRSSL